MHKITICPGFDKNNQAETYLPFDLERGKIYAIVGNTGSGKSRLLKDIEQLVNMDSVTKRKICIDEKIIDSDERFDFSNHMIAHLSQNMRFTLDTSVNAFLALHKACRHIQIDTDAVIALANTITAEPIHGQNSLNLLSGGQSRALMIADIACICDSPIVLIDEIENAGIDKMKALHALYRSDKIILIVTHDPHTALMADMRIVMNNGSIQTILKKDPQETELCTRLDEIYQQQLRMQARLRKGERCI